MHLITPDPIDHPAGPLGRVGVIVPRWVPTEQAETQGIPFRVFTLAEALLRAGYEVLYCDQEVDLIRVDRTAELLRGLAGAVGVFIWMNEPYPYHQCVNAAKLTAIVKQAAGVPPVIVGGEFVTICPPAMFDFPSQIDFFLRGYGERAGPELLDRLKHGGDPESVPGVLSRRGGRLRYSEPENRADFIPEYLDFYRRIDLAPYVQRGGIFGGDGPTLTLAAGRGCTKGCYFCTWRSHPSRVVRAEHVVRLVRDLRDRYGVKQFHFAELDFFLSRTRALETARLMRELAPDCRWFALGSPSDLVRFTDEDWDLLAAGGLRKVEMGSESGSGELLRRIGKRHSPEDIFVVSARMAARGIVPMNNFLFGFPRETRADRAASLRMIRRLTDLAPEAPCLTFRFFQPSWGTPTGDEALAAMPNPFRTVEDFLARRHAFAADGERTLPWLSPADEAEVKALVNHYLPLITSRLSLRPALRQAAYRSLRGMASRRIAKDRRLPAWDINAYRRFVDEPLDATYTP